MTQLLDRAIEHLQMAKLGWELRSLGRMTEELLNARAAIDQAIIDSSGAELLQHVAEVRAVVDSVQSKERK